MSYLDVPRLHFAGEFNSDPSTVDNRLANFTPGAPLVPLWNANGKHWFSFQDCTVRSALDNTGTILNTPASDSLITGAVETTNNPQFAKLVDLDTEHQSSSQIWGLEIKVTLAGGAAELKGRMETATLRDLWARRAPGGFAAGFGGVYQSVLTGVTFTSPAGPISSRVLNQLYGATTLSIKFVLYAYNAKPGTPKFTFGKVVGTIGKVAPGEPEHFVAARRIEAPASQAYFRAPFKVDAARRKLVIDLGNAIPEDASGGRAALGTMEAQILGAAGGAPTVLGSILYDQGHYEATAGVEEVPLTPAQVTSLNSRPVGIALGMVPSGPAFAERPGGSYLDASEVAFRLNPGENKTVEFAATAFGAPKAGQKIGLRLKPGRSPAAALTFPASVTTGADGRARATFTAADPGHPRADVDGQVYFVAFDWGVAAPPAAPDERGQIVVRVFDRHAPVVSPTWAHVRPILEEYARMYPWMKARLDLSDYAKVKAEAALINTTLTYPETDPRYMPVSRDLSKDKRTLLTRWIARGCPP